jgi:G:T-mismatch repair DNA endonuclease (very short patch repair protein)
MALLSESGWRVLTIWECEVADREQLTRRLHSLLG